MVDENQRKEEEKRSLIIWDIYGKKLLVDTLPNISEKLQKILDNDVQKNVEDVLSDIEILIDNVREYVAILSKIHVPIPGSDEVKSDVLDLSKMIQELCLDDGGIGTADDRNNTRLIMSEIKSTMINHRSSFGG